MTTDNPTARPRASFGWSVPTELDPNLFDRTEDGDDDEADTMDDTCVGIGTTGNPGDSGAWTIPISATSDRSWDWPTVGLVLAMVTGAIVFGLLLTSQ